MNSKKKRTKDMDIDELLTLYKANKRDLRSLEEQKKRVLKELEN